MHKISISLVCATFCALAPLSRAQDDIGAPAPAAELEKFEPLVGDWSGNGVFHDPQAGAMKWTSTGGYQWSHGGFWLREDFTIDFEGMDTPMVIRAYLGWDAENQRYVTLHAANNGEVGLDELHFQPDGTMTMFAVKHMMGQVYTERANTKVTDDKMTMVIDFLMPAGPSMKIVEGSFTRMDGTAPNALACKTAFGAPPHEAMGKIGRGAGVYDIKGSMTMAPGMPAMKIHGTDTFKKIFGGTVFHGHTLGGSDMMPGEYIADVFWGWNEKRNCYTSVFVSNMGESGEMDMRFSQDGKQLISTSAVTMQGIPMVQRFVLELDDNGSYVQGVGHSLAGNAPPMESFKATYTKKN